MASDDGMMTRDLETIDSGSKPVSLSGALRSGIGGLQARDSVVIGRAADCDVRVKDVKVSRHHCRLTRSDDGFVLEDLESRNGTFVQGRRIAQPVRLKPSESFQVGDTIFYLA